MAARLSCLLFAVLILATPASADDAISALIDVNVRTWDTADGLPHNMVHDVVQTDDGYLWFGTWEGLTRFNGYEFEVFSPENTPGLADRGVRALAVDHNSALWVGTARAGIARVQGGAWDRYGEADGLAGDEVLTMHVAADGRLWIGTEASGLSVFDGSTFRTIDRSNGLQDNTVVALSEAPAGVLWVAGRTRLQRVTDEGVTLFGEADGLPADAAPLSLAVDLAGNLVVGTEHGLFRQAGARFERHPAWPASADRRQLAQILMDSSGVLWAGSFAKGAFALRGDGVYQLTTRTGLPNNRVTAIFEDGEGNVWLGTSGGLTRVNAGVFGTLTERSGLTDAYVRAVAPVGPGQAWIATSDGLNFFDRGRVVTFDESDGLVSSSVLSLWVETDGSVLVGTYGAGMNRVTADGQVEPFEVPGLPSGHVRSILRSRDGSLWLGTIRGVAHRDETRTRVYTTTDGLPRDYTMSVTEDRDGIIWVGGIESLARIEDGRLEVIPPTPGGYDGSDVFDVHQADDGTIWLATETGLVHLDAGSSARIGRRQGLPHEVVFGIVEDADGFFWMSSNAGVFRVSRNDLQAVSSGTAASAPFRRFSESDGLVSRQANGGSTPALAAGPDGHIWVATSKGAAVIDPHDLETRIVVTPPASVAVEQLLIDGVAADLSHPIRIVPGTRHLEFRYAGLKLAAPDSVDYRYRLDGYDDDWQIAESRRSANYTNLDPGEYRFLVEAGVEGIWAPTPAALALVIEPYFYETSVFYAGLAVALMLVIAGFVRARLAGLRRQTERLEQEVASRTAALSERTADLERLADEKTDLAVRLERQSAAF
ncbi:MAG: two-component regulator propeller domain-containing protein, partial [Pseudomonadota bacterium]